MTDPKFQPSSGDGQWFNIKVSRPGGPGKGWPIGETYMSQAVHDALAYQSYMIVANKQSAARLTAFTWESGGPAGNYLRDQDGWYLGYDGPSKCLCRRSKALSSFWEAQQRDGIWYLRDITADSRFLSWLPNQNWPLADTKLFISEHPGGEFALQVGFEKVPTPAGA